MEEVYCPSNPRYFKCCLLQLIVLTSNEKERTYPNSGHLALSAADHMADNSAIMTGRVHPHHSSISQPNAPVPAASNADKDATENLYTDGSGPEESHLLGRNMLVMRDPQTGRDK